MKKVLLSTALLCIAGMSQAQFTKGQTALGGQLSFSTVTSNLTYTPATPTWVKSRATQFSVSPSVSFFSSPTAMSSFGVTYANNITKTDNPPSGSVQKNTTNSAGLFFRLTKLNRLANRFYFTYGGGPTVSYSKSKDEFISSPESTSSMVNVGINGGIGLLYQLNNRLLLTTNLNNVLAASYYHAEYKAGSVGAGNANGFSFSTGLSGFSLNSLSIGMMLLLK